MADDDVGGEAQALQLPRLARHRLCTRHGMGEILRVRVPREVGAARRPVGDPPHAGNGVGVWLADEHHIVALLLQQMAHQMHELARIVLVGRRGISRAPLAGIVIRAARLPNVHAPLPTAFSAGFAGAAGRAAGRATGLAAGLVTALVAALAWARGTTITQNASSGAKLSASQASPEPTGPTAEPSVKVPLTCRAWLSPALPRRRTAQAKDRQRHATAAAELPRFRPGRQPATAEHRLILDVLRRHFGPAWRERKPLDPAAAAALPHPIAQPRQHVATGLYVGRDLRVAHRRLPARVPASAPRRWPPRWPPASLRPGG